MRYAEPVALILFIAATMASVHASSPEGTPSSTNSGPFTVCSSPAFDFGTLDNENTVEHEFVLGNVGNTVLKIDKVVACCGSTTELSAYAVPPGRTATLKIMVPLKGRTGGQDMGFYVRSNDPVHPLFELRIRGTALAKVDIQPPGVFFGVLDEDAATERTVNIVCQSNIVFSITNLVSPSRYVTASYAGIDRNVHCVSVKTVPPLPLGITRSVILVQTDHKKYGVIEIPVLAKVSRDIVVFPDELRLARNDGGQFPCSRYVVVRSLSKAAFKIVGSRAPLEGIGVVWSAMANGGYRVEISNLRPLDELDGREIVLEIDNAGVGEAAIPIRIIKSRGP